MTLLLLVLRSFRFYWKRNILVMAGVALSAAVFTGALMIGDSMRYSLKQIVHARLGSTTWVVETSDRFFTAALADSMARFIPGNIAPLFVSQGSAIADGGRDRVNRVQFIGIDSRFQTIAGSTAYGEMKEEEVIINAQLAGRLKVKAGDALLFRVAKASLVPLNTPFVSESETTVSFRSTIARVVTSEECGDFYLQNAQSTPYNVFLPLEQLNHLMGMEGRSNRLLLEGDSTQAFVDSVLSASLRPQDVGLKLDFFPDKQEFGISSERIFLDSMTWNLFGAVEEKRDVLTYFVNSIRRNNQVLPYSFVSSWSGLPVNEGEIILNDWAANDLKARVGDTITITWFEIGPLRQLVEKSHSLKVSDVVPITGEYGDSGLMPSIPGLSDAGHCREWKAGIPIALDKIRDKDEAYWNQYKGTPKAFVSCNIAKLWWSNRYGSSTSIRIPAGHFSEEEYYSVFKSSVVAADFGLFARPVKSEGLKAAEGGSDFGQLFFGLSFFLLLSAVLITALLFRLNLETRESQIGTMLQLGFTRRQLSRIFLSEGILVVLPGIVAGLLLGIGYVRIIFYFLNSLWFDIVRTSVILLQVKFTTLLAGFILTLVISSLSLWFPLRNYLGKAVVSLQHKGGTSGNPSDYSRRWWLGIIPLLAGILISVYQIVGGASQIPGYFFLSGFLILAGTLWIIKILIESIRQRQQQFIGFNSLILRSVSRHVNRSMAIVITFSLGAFLLIAVGANRSKMTLSAGEKQSGTGGFGFFAETVVPVLHDLNDPDRRLSDGLDSSLNMVQLSRMSGDDASCLNLNRVTNPSILGVDVSTLSGRFEFQTLTDGMNLVNPWLSLKEILPGNVIPAVADQTVIQWGLGMKTGDTLLYLGEKGDTLRLRLIGGLLPSVFQGYVLVDQSHFLNYFPSHSGSSVFLITNSDEEVKDELLNQYRDYGMDIIPTPEKLATFQSVTNTYLSIFMTLGFLALAIGTLGILVVVARTLLERRREMALMQAMGYSRRSLVWMMVAEYSGLLAAALSIALITAFLALLPALLDGSLTVSLTFSGLLFLGIVIHVLLWIALISFRMLNKGKLIPEIVRE